MRLKVSTTKTSTILPRDQGVELLLDVDKAVYFSSGQIHEMLPYLVHQCFAIAFGICVTARPSRH